MHVASIDTSRPATGTGATTNPSDRHNTLRDFVVTNYQELTEAAHEASHNKLFFSTPEVIVGTLVANLHRYGGPTDATSFMKWAQRFVSKEARRFLITGEIMEKHSNLIYKCIHESLWTSAVDWAVTPEDIYWEVVFLIFQRATSLGSKGTAKLTSRLWELTEKHVYLYYNSKNNKRRKAVERNVDRISCERLSDMELAAMREESGGVNPVDAGYAELGFSTI